MDILIFSINEIQFNKPPNSIQCTDGVGRQSVELYGSVIFATDGRLVSCLSYLLGALLPSGPSWSFLSAPVPSCFSPQLLSFAFLWHNCSFRSWFCLVMNSTVVARVCTYLSRAVMRGSSSLLLLVAIKRMSTIQLFVWEMVIWLLLFSPFPQTTPTNDTKNR